MDRGGLLQDRTKKGRTPAPTAYAMTMSYTPHWRKESSDEERLLCRGLWCIGRVRLFVTNPSCAPLVHYTAQEQQQAAEDCGPILTYTSSPLCCWIIGMSEGRLLLLIIPLFSACQHLAKDALPENRRFLLRSTNRHKRPEWPCQFCVNLHSDACTFANGHERRSFFTSYSIFLKN